MVAWPKFTESEPWTFVVPLSRAALAVEATNEEALRATMRHDEYRAPFESIGVRPLARG